MLPDPLQSAPASASKALIRRLPKLPARLPRDRDFLPAALEIIETPASPAGRSIGAVIIAATVISLAWAYFGKVDIIATAPGHIVPVGRTKTVQPLETGVVSAIRVADGDHVQAGDILVELDPTAAGADRDRYARDLLQAELDLARLQALQRHFDIDAEPALLDAPAAATAVQLNATRAAIRSAAGEEKAKLLSLDQQIAEKKAEAEEAAQSITRLQASLPLVNQAAEIRTQLKDMQFGNKLAWLDAEQKLVEQKHEIAVLGQHREQALASAAGLRRQREETEAEYQKTVLADLDKAQSRVTELTADFTKAARKMTEQELRAPIDGTVQQLAVHTIGGVVTPAQPLLVLVPDSAGLMVEASVRNQDVGFVHAGQTAQIKVNTFSFTRYGLIGGRVMAVSPDAVNYPESQRHPAGEESTEETETGGKEPAYVAHISLSRDWMDTETGRVRLGPGMSVQAEIQTGRRRIIDYILSPLAGHIQESGHER